MKKVRKAVIPAAGLGIRFLPATKSIPKEMFPLIDKPTIQYIVEEAVASGIEDILIVTGRNKWSIENHFDRNLEVEANLKQSGKLSLLETIENISNMADIHFIRQKHTLGLGHAISCARKFIGNEPFAVLLGDNIIDHETPCLKQMVDIYKSEQSSIIAIEPVDMEATKKFGVIAGQPVQNDLYLIDHLVEKPQSNPPSNLAIIGRYILEPEIFQILESIPAGVGGEIQLTDALQILAKRNPLYGYLIQGTLYDIGDKVGYLKANLEMACKDPQMKKDLHAYLLQFIQTLGE